MTAEQDLPSEYTNVEMTRLLELLGLVPPEGIAWFGSSIRHVRDGFVDFVPHVYTMSSSKNPQQALYAINDSLIAWGLNPPGEARRGYSEEENTPVLVAFRPAREADTTRLLMHPTEIFDPELYAGIGIIAIAAGKDYTPNLSIHRRMVNTAIIEMISLLRGNQLTDSAERSTAS